MVHSLEIIVSISHLSFVACSDKALRFQEFTYQSERSFWCHGEGDSFLQIWYREKQEDTPQL